MTTPAVNEQVHPEYIFGRIQAFREDGTPDGAFTTNGRIGMLTGRYSRIRPASQSNDFHPNGFRRLGDWSHRGIDQPVPTGQMMRVTGTGRYGLSGPYDAWNEGPRPGIPGYSQSARNLALNKAIAGLKQGDLNLGVSLAEANQTVRLISDSFRKITRGVRYYRKSRKKDWSNRRQWGDSSAVPSSWLELNYGWRPLLRDIHGAAEWLNSEALAEGFVAHTSGRHFVSDDYIQTGNPTTRRLDWLGQVTYNAEVNLYYKLLSKKAALLSSLGLTNPSLIVWEKVPYSFVVDWALPVGTFLEALGADHGWGWITGCRSEMSRHELVARYSKTNTSGVQYVQGPGARLNCTSTAFNFNRYVYDSKPTPGVPLMKNPISVSHAASALSLLYMAIYDRPNYR